VALSQAALGQAQAGIAVGNESSGLFNDSI